MWGGTGCGEALGPSNPSSTPSLGQVSHLGPSSLRWTFSKKRPLTSLPLSLTVASFTTQTLAASNLQPNPWTPGRSPSAVGERFA